MNDKPVIDNKLMKTIFFCATALFLQANVLFANLVTPIHTPAQYHDAAKAYLKSSSSALQSGQISILLVSLVDDAPPHVFRLRDFETEVLTAGVAFSEGSDDTFFRGHIAVASTGGQPGRVTLGLELHYRARTLVDPSGTYVPGVNLEAKLDVNLREREIVLLSAESSRDHGVASGAALLIVRGG